jgi:hypothetical protein
MRKPGIKKNTRRPLQAVGSHAAACMQCNRPADMTWVDDRGEVQIRTTWCNSHSPDVWKMVARNRRIQENLQDVADREAHEWQLQGWPA